MKILAIDTTENTAAAAICEDEMLLSSFQITKMKTHSESMLPMIDAMLTLLHLSVDQIDLFALSAGPGSFTGVRIGAAGIKGLCFGRNKPIVAVSALEAMAWNHLYADGLICPVMDARRGQVYAALLRVQDGNVVYIDGLKDQVIMAQELVDRIGERFPGETVRFTGGAYEALVQLASAQGGFHLGYTPESLRYEHAYGVALCAFKKYMADPTCAVNDASLVPIYLRASQAERERLKKEEKEKLQYNHS